WFAARLVRRDVLMSAADLAMFVVGGAATFALGVLPFAAEHGWGWIVGKYADTLGSYSYATLNAFNLFALLGGNGLPNTDTFLGVPYVDWAIGLIALVLLFACVVAIKGKDPSRFWYLAMFLPASAFVVSTKMHERYLFPALAMGLALVIASRDWRGISAWLFAGFSITQFLNAGQVLALSRHDIYLVPANNLTLRAISLANVVLWALLVWVGYRRYIAPKPEPPIVAEEGIRRWHVAVLACILLATTILRLYRLQVPDHYYFDEIYFGYTAKQTLAGNPDVYDPWAKNPEGVNNAWDHPPLGKLIMAGTMAVAGTGPAGMRLSSAAMGSAAVGLVFLLAVALFGSPRAGLLAAALYSLEGLAFVQSRIATVDSHLVAFMLAALYCYMRWRKNGPGHPSWLAGAGLAAGATLATKWTGLYLVALLGLDCLIFLGIMLFARSNRRALWTMLPVFAWLCLLAAPYCYFHWMKGGPSSPLWLIDSGFTAGATAAPAWVAKYLLVLLGIEVLAFVAITPFARSHLRVAWTVLLAFNCLCLLPPLVYLASYTQFFHFGRGWHDFATLQYQMWHYHTHEAATHPYQSKPGQWMLNLRPVWFHVDYGPGAKIAQIYNLGNSVVLYLGLAAMAALVVRWARQRTWPAAFLLAGYLIMWLPWALSPRLMFFYHYLPAVPLLCVASGLLLARWLADGRLAVRLAAWAVVALAVAWFVFFFPHMTAISLPRSWSDAAYYWIGSWR
ncbi:MAG: phospholipid carrier-dependent glycosyltransferase, partial [Phycisphaerae bacterium]|nr:phospholipid carrier-dependent glycosyltransferase [Phycisphaerae bacterium]